MNHWTDGLESEDSDGFLVRPYAITRGRTAPERDDLTLITVVTTMDTGGGPEGEGPADDDDGAGGPGPLDGEDATAGPDGAGGPEIRPGLEPEHRTILEQCREPAAVAEIAAGLNLPVSVTKILIGDLVSLGRVTIRPPLAAEQGSGLDMNILQAVRDGLRAL